MGVAITSIYQSKLILIEFVSFDRFSLIPFLSLFVYQFWPYDFSNSPF